MATIGFSGSWISRGVHQTQWVLGNADTGVAQSNAALSDKSVQVNGTIGGATVVVEGSNDGVTYATLTDPAGAALSFVAAGGPKQILQNPKFIRASTSGGTGSAITVTMIERGGAI